MKKIDPSKIQFTPMQVKIIVDSFNELLEELAKKGLIELEEENKE